MKQKAFTLLEVMVALTLFSIAVLGILRLLPLSQRYIQQSGYATQASFLAQEEIEKIRSTDYASLTVGASPAYEPLAAVSTASGDPLAKFSRTTVISYVDPASNYAASATDLGMKKVVVTVSWVEGKRTPQFTLTTYAYNH